MMNLEYARPDLEALLRGASSRADLVAFFDKIAQVTQELRGPDIYGRKLFVRWLDAQIPSIAARLQMVDTPTPPKSNARIVVIATAMHTTGGHSQVIKDVMRTFPGQVSAIYTDIYGAFPPDFADGRIHSPVFQDRACIFARRRLILDRAVEVYMALRAIQPTRILLFGHPMDLTPIVGAWPFRQVVEFMHHADHIPAIGATLPFSSHVDLTYRCHLACREAGLDAVFAGMKAPLNLSAPPRPPKSNDEAVVIATSGNPSKFRGASAFSWADYVTAALKAYPNSRLVHIGPPYEGVENEIRPALVAAGVDPSRYLVTGPVQSVRDELLARGADVYLSSYPESGGKANLEAMAARVPIIFPLDADAPPLIQFDHPLRRWTRVSSPSEISGAIATAIASTAGLFTQASDDELQAEFGRFDRFSRGELTGASVPGA